MIKIVAVILALLILSAVFLAPLWNHRTTPFLKDKMALEEGEIIGTVLGYNPRVAEIQTSLEMLKFDPGPLDGIMGARTRQAIAEFQKLHQLEPTGKINSETLNVLNRQKQKWGSAHQEPDSLQSAPLDLHSAVPVADPEPGSFSWKQAKQWLKTKEGVKTIQVFLKEQHFYKGKIDGKRGAKTKAALKGFQKAKGLKADGVLGPKTWEELRKMLAFEKAGSVEVELPSP